MANIGWNTGSAATNRKRHRLGNRWLVSGITANCTTGDVLYTGMKGVLNSMLTVGGATGATIAAFPGAGGTITIVHGTGGAAPIHVLAICR